MQVNLIDAHVHIREGAGEREAGRVWRVAMEPASRQVTHLVVHQGFLLGRNVVVPIAHVTHMAEGHVYLDMSEDALRRCPDFQETDFLDPEENWDYPVGYPPGGVVWPMAMGYAGASGYPLMTNAVVKENIPDEDVTLASGTHVECVDGHCGKVERVLVDDTTNQMTGFVIKKGFFFTRDVKAPMSWIDHVDHDAVHLKLTKRQVEEMAEYFE